MLVFDGFQPFRDDAHYTSTPFVFVPFGIGPRRRWKAGWCHTICMVPGRRDKGGKVDIKYALSLIVDEILYLCVNGVEAEDADAKEKIRVKLTTCLVRADYRGLQSIMSRCPLLIVVQLGSSTCCFLCTRQV